MAVPFFLEDFWDSAEKLELFTDAAGSLGFGAIFGRKWCYGKWPDNWLHQNIAILEFYPIVLSLYLWGHHMQNCSILRHWCMSLISSPARTRI